MISRSHQLQRSQPRKTPILPKTFYPLLLLIRNQPSNRNRNAPQNPRQAHRAAPRTSGTRRGHSDRLHESNLRSADRAGEHWRVASCWHFRGMCAPVFLGLYSESAPVSMKGRGKESKKKTEAWGDEVGKEKREECVCTGRWVWGKIGYRESKKAGIDGRGDREGDMLLGRFEG